MLAKSYNKENLVRSLFATVCAMVTHSMLKEAPWRVELRFSFSKIFPLSAESLSLKNRHFWYFQAFCYQSFKNDITLSAGGYRRVREGTGGYGRVREGTGRKILPCSGLAFWPRSGPLRELLVKTYSKAPYKQLQKVFNNLSLHYLQQVFCFIFVFSLCLTKINYKFSRPLTFCTIKRIKFP